MDKEQNEFYPVTNCVSKLTATELSQISGGKRKKRSAHYWVRCGVSIAATEAGFSGFGPGGMLVGAAAGAVMGC